MRILAALVVLSVVAGVRPADQVTCDHPILCPCGNTGKDVKVCVEEEEKEESCKRWSKCKTCQDGLDGCLECPEGLEGPLCSKVTGPEALSRQKRQFYMYPPRGPNRFQYSRIEQEGGSCPEINSPKYGSIRCVYNIDQRTCEGKCLPGYSFEGYGSQSEMTLTCRRGQYSPFSKFPPCKSGGHCDLDIQGPGSFNCTTGMNGTRCDVLCGGRFIGRYFCFPMQDWDPPLPHCVRPKEVKRGRQACSCEHGGTCGSNGNCVCPPGRTGILCEQIVPERQTCRDPGFVENGLRRDRGEAESIERRLFEEGEFVMYSCISSEYALQGSPRLTCRNGEWSRPLPTCIRTLVSSPIVVTYCPDPGVDPNGSRNPRLPPNYRGFPQDSSLEYFCNQGYVLEGETIISCLRSRRWSSGRPNCKFFGEKEEACLNPGVISNGRIVYYPPVDERHGGRPRIAPADIDFPVGGMLRYTCDSGHRLAGRDSLTCEDDGTWSSGPPACIGARRPCLNPGPFSNGRTVYYPPLVLGRRGQPQSTADLPEFPNGGLILYFCDSGFTLLGSDSLTCEDNGEWSAEPPVCGGGRSAGSFCVDPGIDPNGSRNPSLPPNRRGFPEGAMLVYSCNQGYELEGEMHVLCLSSGDWRSRIPTCKSRTPENIQQARYCDDPGPISRGRVEYTPPPNQLMTRTTDDRKIQYPPGGRLVYSCDNDYFRNGAAILTCEDTGNWSHRKPTCSLDSVDCAHPGPFVNGWIRSRNHSGRPRQGSMSLVADDVEAFPEGTMLQYECLDGYSIRGSESITCQSTGVWDPPLPPECELECGRSRSGSIHKIHYGNKTEIGEFPWVVAIATQKPGLRPRVVCGGAVINTHTVLTAAHCVPRGTPYILFFGKYYRDTRLDDEDVQRRDGENVIIHHAYNNRSQDSDIALIKFSPPIRYTPRVEPICLPSPRSTATNLERGRRGYVTGWGQNENINPSPELMMAYLPIHNNTECLTSFRSFNFRPSLSDNMFCSGLAEGNQSVCEGDSGSPFVFYNNVTGRHTVEGIVSFSAPEDCGVPGKFGVYTKVLRFIDWIHRNMR